METKGVCECLCGLDLRVSAGIRPVAFGSPNIQTPPRASNKHETHPMRSEALQRGGAPSVLSPIGRCMVLYHNQARRREPGIPRFSSATSGEHGTYQDLMPARCPASAAFLRFRGVSCQGRARSVSRCARAAPGRGGRDHLRMTLTPKIGTDKNTEGGKGGGGGQGRRGARRRTGKAAHQREDLAS